MGTSHPEIPSDDERDQTLLITEAQQQEFLEKLVEIEHEMRRTLHSAISEAPQIRTVLEDGLAEFSELAARARRATRNAVTVEERIAHLDFETPNDP